MAPRDRRDSDGLDEFGGSTRLQHADSIRSLLDEMQTTEDDKPTREMDPQLFRALLKTEAAKRPVPEPEIIVEPAPEVEEPVAVLEVKVEEPVAQPAKPSAVSWRTWALMALLVAVAALTFVLRA